MFEKTKINEKKAAVGPFFQKINSFIEYIIYFVPNGTSFDFFCSLVDFYTYHALSLWVGE